ncbi:hypothetical protein IVY21_25160 [Salmonella enterica subsp. enterica serovar Worthington]|nr:hypothetical protein [Salmonella enterica subsp. enterica serovar Worthington]MBP1524868.1 hypothetical protein [Salmonella enterica subsp. enterica serovar Worthington]
MIRSISPPRSRTLAAINRSPLLSSQRRAAASHASPACLRVSWREQSPLLVFEP